MNEEGDISTQIVGHALLIEVDRSAKMNGFTPTMFEGIENALFELERQEELWVGIMTFKGEHTTAGLDLPKFFGPDAKPTENSDVHPDVFGIRKKCSKPLIMAVQGITYTIGIEMMLASDIVVASEDCRFCQLEPKRGLAVFGGAHVRYVQRAGWGNAMYHLLRADEFDATCAKDLGFVQEVVPVGHQVSRALEIAEEICECSPLALREIKRAALVYLEDGEEAAFKEIPTMRETTLGSEDAKEGMKSFIERRKPNFNGR